MAHNAGLHGSAASRARRRPRKLRRRLAAAKDELASPRLQRLRKPSKGMVKPPALRAADCPAARREIVEYVDWNDRALGSGRGQRPADREGEGPGEARGAIYRSSASNRVSGSRRRDGL
jgi:hypothetical protein